jgi:hypothetical protein
VPPPRHSLSFSTKGSWCVVSNDLTMHYCLNLDFPDYRIHPQMNLGGMHGLPLTGQCDELRKVTPSLTPSCGFALHGVIRIQPLRVVGTPFRFQRKGRGVSFQTTYPYTPRWKRGAGRIFHPQMNLGVMHRLPLQGNVPHPRRGSNNEVIRFLYML